LDGVAVWCAQSATLKGSTGVWWQGGLERMSFCLVSESRVSP
jgi:hypothetical protein